jgi:hypothetical protein
MLELVLLRVFRFMRSMLCIPSLVRRVAWRRRSILDIYSHTLHVLRVQKAAQPDFDFAPSRGGTLSLYTLLGFRAAS